jgi:hypothetical protein
MKLENNYARYVFKMLLAAILFLTACKNNVLPSFLAGTYTGKEQIIIRYDKDGQYIYKEDVVMISLFMDSLGHVTGMIGEAELEDCNVTKNRGWIGQRLGIKTDFLIRGILKGNTFDKDTIFTKSISIPFNIENDELKGGLFYISNGNDFSVIKHLNLQKLKD